MSARRMLALTREHRGSIALSAGLSLAGSALVLAQPLVVRQVIDAAHAHAVQWTTVGGLAGLFAGQALLRTVTGYTLGRTGEAVVFGIRAALIGHLLRLPVPVYRRHRVGDLISRAGADTSALHTAVVAGCSDAVTGSLGLVGTVVLMAWLDTSLFLVVMCVTAVSAAVVLPVLPRLRKASGEGQRALGAMASDLERALSAIRTVRASRAESRETDRIVGQARLAREAGLRMIRLQAVVVPVSELAVQAALLATVIVGGIRVADGTASIAELVAFLLYLSYLTVPVVALLNAATTLQQAAGATARLAEVLGLPTETSPNAPVPLPASTAGRRPPPPATTGVTPVMGTTPTTGTAVPTAATTLEFHDVWFGYDPQRPVLRGASFHLPRQGPSALLGHSGAGKSTVVDLIERFHDPDRGRILLHGTDIRHVPLAEHRSRIGLVEQECPILYGTLRDNLAYAAPRTDDEHLLRVLQETGLGAFVRGLPEGLDTPIGEHGCTLSGGERQRIAIARALLSRPSLILLDEPTAHLDAAGEAALLRTVHRISRHCALLVIAHRRSTVQGIGRRLVLKDGTVSTHTGGH
ncbi:ABC transporter ATP-binding protein [Streptomyces hiroshimensis]|uniref:ABC transporter n=1 Tax=Streptomyces hiroshimensis TaxID=66424 RepID=A0ABQ2Z0T2_9ACTN|nr:ABC transporter ATP-binding protein [Streptomyces hiroshimensis]GGY00879.1 ABC transporter [Streptomyces hiroshimensis]